MLQIGQTLDKVPEAAQVIEEAEVRFSRESVFDQTSKLLVMCQRCPSSTDFLYVLKGIYCQMMWQDSGDVVKKDDLTSRSGSLQVWLFLRRLVGWVQKKYNFRGENAEVCRAIEKVQDLWACPLQWKVAADSDLSWTSALPVPLQKIHDILTKTFLGSHDDALKGLLANVVTVLQPEDFLASKKLKPHMEDFEKSYKKYMGEEEVAPDDAAAKTNAEKEANAEGSQPDSLEKLQADAKTQADQLLQKRFVPGIFLGMSGVSGVVGLCWRKLQRASPTNSCATKFC